MKIDWKSKQTKFVIILLAVILIPIIVNQAKTLAIGLYTAYMMKQPKEVQILKPESREINPEFQTTGRIEANLSVDVIARVPGWLEKRYFEEGDRVKKGQRLFLIEQSEYLLAAKNARAQVNQDRAVYKNSEIDLKRASELLKEDLVSREYYDNALTDRNKYKAALDGAVAQAQKANLELSYTNITSPMDGRIGKANYSVGNYVTPESGVIAQIYSTNPMRVVFHMKSGDFIEMKRYLKDNPHLGKDQPDKKYISIILTLADGSKYEKEGKIEFFDNKVDESTGTVTLRAVFDNPNEILVPGDFVNVTIRINQPQKVMLIPQSATKTDVGTGYYVWVAKDGKAVRKDIVVNYNIDNNWVVESGLDYNDDIVVKGIQDVYKTGQELKVTPYVPENDKAIQESKDNE